MDSSKSPFDDPEFPGKSESATGDASSATAIFGTVSAKPSSQQDDDLLKSLMGAQSSSSFVAEAPSPTSPAPPQTQPWTPVAPPTPAPQVASSSGPGEFTEIFRAMQSPAPAATPPASSARDGSPPPNPPPKAPADLANVFTQVVVEKTTFTPPPAPPPPPSKPGEFTQLLQTLNAPTQKQEPELAAPPQPPATGTRALLRSSSMRSRGSQPNPSDLRDACGSSTGSSGSTVFQAGYARRSRRFHPHVSVATAHAAGGIPDGPTNSSSAAFRTGVVHADVLRETNGEHSQRRSSEVVEGRTASAKYLPVFKPRPSARRHAPAQGGFTQLLQA